MSTITEAHQSLFNRGTAIGRERAERERSTPTVKEAQVLRSFRQSLEREYARPCPHRSRVPDRFVLEKGDRSKILFDIAGDRVLYSRAKSGKDLL